MISETAKIIVQFFPVYLHLAMLSKNFCMSGETISELNILQSYSLLESQLNMRSVSYWRLFYVTFTTPQKGTKTNVMVF